MSERHHSERERFFGATKIIAGLTLLSRVGGLLRAMAIAWLGAQRATDAFSFAFKIPNFFRRLFGEGALAAAFVPVFTEVNEKQGPQAADRLLSNALGLLGVLLTVLTVAILAVLWWPGGNWRSDWDRVLLLGLSSVMLPFMLTVCMLALASAALNCRGHFAYPAAAPIILNAVIIIAAWLVAPLWRDDLVGKLYVIAASVSVAGVVQLAGAWLLLKKHGFAVRPRLWPIEPPIRQVVRTMGPMLVGLGLLQLVELLETGLAWYLTSTTGDELLHLGGWSIRRPLAEGVLVRLDNARYLYQFPLGVLANSLAVAVFPLLSRYGSRGDWPSLRSSVNRALRLSVMEGLAAGVGLVILAEPIIRLIFMHGQYNAADARQTASILQVYALGMWAYCSYQILARAFYSLKDTLTPLRVSMCLVVLQLALVTALVWSLGPVAFGATTAVVFSVNALALSLLLRRRIGPFGGRALLTSVGRSMLACAAMGLALVGLKDFALAGRSDVVIVCVCVPAGAAVFLAAMRLLRAPELSELVGRARRQAPATCEALPTGGEESTGGAQTPEDMK